MAEPYYVEGGGGYVYLVFDTGTGLHKLGATRRLYDRLKALAAATLNELHLVWYVATNDHRRLESAWHRYWARDRVVNEWFRVTESQVAEFKAVRSVRFTEAYPDAYVPTGDPFDFPTRSVKRVARSVVRVGSPITERRRH